MAKTNGKRQGAAAGGTGVASPEPRGSLLYEVLKGIDFERRELVGKKTGTGLFDLTKHPDGRLRCYACTLCERTCPVDCIDIEYCPEFPEGHWDVAAERAAAEAAQPDVDMKLFDTVVSRLRDGSGLIQALHATQGVYGYLPRRALQGIADEMGVKLSHVYGVASFYTQFRLQPVGKHIISVCVGTACHVAGAPLVVEAFSQALEVGVGETSADGLFTLQTVNCVGSCALAPVVRVGDDDTIGRVSPNDARKLVRRLRRSEEA
jgi:NADH-quinone oxidoreductase subunit E